MEGEKQIWLIRRQYEDYNRMNTTRRTIIKAMTLGAVAAAVPVEANQRKSEGTRISVRESDPGYHPRAYGAKVYVDGVEMDKCHTADEVLGIAYCHASDKDGNAYIDPANPGQVKEVEIKGVVRIVPPKASNH